jgi:hypothetical protein
MITSEDRTQSTDAIFAELHALLSSVEEKIALLTGTATLKKAA